jgi:protein involved in polysaccharide export with SLBB domain
MAASIPSFPVARADLSRPLGLPRQARKPAGPRQTVIRLIVLLLGLGLGACEPARSYERVGDGSIQYLDQLSEPQKGEARARIVQTLIRGFDVYELQIGDEFEVFFHVKRQPSPREYVISVADKLRIEFLSETENNRVIQVRPDGRISVPLIGPVMAAGKTADALARELERQYAELLTEPRITVNVTETHSPLEDFLETVGGKARSIVDKVLPDGTIVLPRLPPIRARGRTLRELQREIDLAYAGLGLDITVSLVARGLRPGTALVFGEVGKPGRLESDRPQTVLMIIAQAGGVLPSGSLEAVRVFYIGDDGLQRVRSVNLKDVIDGLRIEEDMIVPTNSVIYVPPTELAKTGRFLDAVLRDILRFQGFSLFGTFQMNNPSGTTVIPQVR